MCITLQSILFPQNKFPFSGKWVSILMNPSQFMFAIKSQRTCGSFPARYTPVHVIYIVSHLHSTRIVSNLELEIFPLIKILHAP